MKMKKMKVKIFELYSLLFSARDFDKKQRNFTSPQANPCVALLYLFIPQCQSRANSARCDLFAFFMKNVKIIQ